MRRKLLRYLASKFGYDLVPKRSPVANDTPFSPSVPQSLPAWIDHLRDILAHPLGGILPQDRSSIPAIPQPLYFKSSLCTAADFRHPEFQRWRHEIRGAARLQRKLWEHVFIAAQLEAAGVLVHGARGLGFGVGREPLPAAFAARGVCVVGTDMASAEAAAAGWIATDQHAAALNDMNDLGICDPEDFARLVSFEICDMNQISPELSGFDFCWSSCSLEHLGSIRNSQDFVKNAMKTLRPGGIAVHTTEYNISSNEDTIDDNPALVILRRRDIEALVADLRSEGHYVAELCFDALTEPVDLFVDIPPYKADAHLRLALGAYVCTSIGIVIQKSFREATP